MKRLLILSWILSVFNAFAGDNKECVELSGIYSSCTNEIGSKLGDFQWETSLNEAGHWVYTLSKQGYHRSIIADNQVRLMSDDVMNDDGDPYVVDCTQNKVRFLKKFARSSNNPAVIWDYILTDEGFYIVQLNGVFDISDLGNKDIMSVKIEREVQRIHCELPSK